MSSPSLPNVKELADGLTFEEQLILLEHLAQRVRMSAPGRRPLDLHGAFRGQFPESFDVEGAIRDIRTSWKRDLDESDSGSREEP